MQILQLVAQGMPDKYRLPSLILRSIRSLGDVVSETFMRDLFKHLKLPLDTELQVRIFVTHVSRFPLVYIEFLHCQCISCL